MSKIYEKILDDLKRANQAAKIKMAAKYGFNSPIDFQNHLSTMISVKTPTVTPKKKKSAKKKAERVMVHNVHILDASGSMSGGKMSRAIEGINTEMIELAKDNSTDITQTIVHFSYRTDIRTYCWKQALSEVEPFICNSRGATALLQTIGETLTKLLSESNGKDKVLVKIFTDGQENDTPHNSEWKNPINVANLIKECESKGFTVTFVGTDEDVKYVINLLSIDRSNTLSHDNTEKGVKMSFAESRGSTVMYRAAASRGEDVTKGFFKKKVGTL